MLEDWLCSVCYCIGNFVVLEACLMSVNVRVETTILLIAACLMILIGTVATLVLFCANKKHFYIQRAGLNPFIKDYLCVLKYTWIHKVPECRRAFTYWKEDIPPCIDLGKNNYGGPLTTEEVENIKTFLRILPLLSCVCLHGYHLADT